MGEKSIVDNLTQPTKFFFAPLFRKLFNGSHRQPDKEKFVGLAFTFLKVARCALLQALYVSL